MAARVTIAATARAICAIKSRAWSGESGTAAIRSWSVAPS